MSDPTDFDSQLDAAMSNSSQSNASHGFDGQLDSAMSGTDVSPVTVTAKKPKTHFQQAVAPQPKDTPELSWSDVGSQALHNAIPSAVEAAKGTAHAIGGLFTGETEGALGNLVKGGASQVAGAFGAKQDPAQKAKNEALIGALENHYKTAYGSVKGFKQALATDPTGVLMDASTFLGGAGAVGKVAGLEKAAAIASKASRLVDPVQMAVTAAKTPLVGLKVLGKKLTPGLADAVPYVQSMYTGKSADALKRAAEVASSGSPEQRAVFKSYLSGSGNPKDIVNAAQDAINQLSKERGQKYVADMKTLKGGALPDIDWTPVNEALQKNLDETVFKNSASGNTTTVNEDANKALQEISQKVDAFQNEPAGSNSHTIEGFDALKRAVGDIRTAHKNDPVAYQKATSMYNSILDSIKNQHPEYAQTMKEYANASETLNEMGATFGLSKKGKKPATFSVLNRLKNSQNDPIKSDLLSQMAEKNPLIPYMMAGQELSPLMPGGLRGAIASVAGIGGAAGLLGPVGGAVAAGAHMAAMSPKIMAKANYTAGRLGKLGNAITGPIPGKASYYAGRADEENSSEPDAQQLDQSPGKPTDKVWDSDEVKKNPVEAAKGIVSGLESSGNYSALSLPKQPVDAPHQAVGKYQVMVQNIGPWTKQYYGQELTPEEFRANPDAQEKVFEGAFGDAFRKYGNLHDALSMWHSGVPLGVAKSQKRHDRSITTAGYVNKGMRTPNGQAFIRAGYARGGAPKLTHDQLVERLMKLTREAKKGENKSTEPLLRVPDAIVVRALDIAQKAI